MDPKLPSFQTPPRQECSPPRFVSNPSSPGSIDDSQLHFPPIVLNIGMLIAKVKSLVPVVTVVLHQLPIHFASFRRFGFAPCASISFLQVEATQLQVLYKALLRRVD